MKRLIALILIGLLVAPPASAGQKPGKAIDWQNVKTLKAGTAVVLTVTGGQSSRVRLLFADEATLVTLKPTTPKLPGGVEKFLLGVGSAWPGIFNTGASSSAHGLRVSKDGVFDGDQKLADLADVVQQTSRGDVLAISEPKHSHVLRNILIGWIVVTVVLLGVIQAVCADCRSN